MRKKTTQPLLPLPLSEEEVIKREVIENEDNDIKIESGVLGAFLTMEDIISSEEKVTRLGFEEYVIGLRAYDVEVTFPMMVDIMGVTFPPTNNNWSNGKISKIFQIR